MPPVGGSCIPHPATRMFAVGLQLAHGYPPRATMMAAGRGMVRSALCAATGIPLPPLLTSLLAQANSARLGLAGFPRSSDNGGRHVRAELSLRRTAVFDGSFPSARGCRTDGALLAPQHNDSKEAVAAQGVGI